MVRFEDVRAFPVTMEDGRGQSMTNLGMTLRDYFAAKAMQGLLATAKTWPTRGDLVNVAELSVQQADALLAALGYSK